MRSGPASAKPGVATVLIVHADDMICSDFLGPGQLAAAVWLLTAVSGRTNPVVVPIVPTSLSRLTGHEPRPRRRLLLRRLGNRGAAHPPAAGPGARGRRRQG